MTHAIRIHKPGGPDVLVWEKIQIGAPGPGQVRLRHTAVGLNFIDVYHRTGLYPLPLPLIPGTEGAGVIEEIGPGVTGFAKGDRVAYAGVIGSYAEERLIQADRLVKIPAGISDQQASAMMLQGMTVRYLIREVYSVKAGDTILIHAAAGGVGLILCQWANALGATVIGTVSSEEKAELARANGCHHPILYTHEDFQKRVMEITQGKKLPVVYDSIGKDTFMQSLDCLQPRGLMALFGQASGPVPPIDINLLAQKGSLYLTRPTLGTFIASAEDLKTTADDLFAVVASGKVKIAVNQTYALKDAELAHRDLEARKTTGSTVFTL